MRPKDPATDGEEFPHRHSMRLQAFDYSSPGAYFVTIVTYERAMLFGAVEHGQAMLSRIGSIADSCWHAIPTHFPHVELGAFVVMPNHVHGILILRATSSVTVGAHDRAPRTGVPARAHHGAPLPADGGIPQAGRGSLGGIIRQYKSSVTRQIIRALGGPRRVWQRNYYEHILRDEADWQRTQLYIDANPMNWEEDEENPRRSAP